MTCLRYPGDKDDKLPLRQHAPSPWLDTPLSMCFAHYGRGTEGTTASLRGGVAGTDPSSLSLASGMHQC